MKARVFKAAEQGLTPGAGLGLKRPCHPSAAGGVLRGTGGSFSVLHSPEEKQLLLNRVCSVLERTFKAYVESLEGVGTQRSFPLLRD